MIRIFILIFICSLYGIFLQAEDMTYTGEIPPVQIGESCHSTDVTYVWKTTTTTKWNLEEIFAAPSGVNPQEWPTNDSFQSALNEKLDGNYSPESIAASLIEIWQDFFESPTELYVVLRRDIQKLTRVISCDEGHYTLTFYEDTVDYDTSELLSVANFKKYYAPGVTSYEITTDLNNMLETLNVQPGADPRPDHQYTTQD